MLFIFLVPEAPPGGPNHRGSARSHRASPWFLPTAMTEQLACRRSSMYDYLGRLFLNPLNGSS